MFDVVSIALVNPPSPFLIDDKVMPPLGLMYLSSYLRQNGVEVEISDLAVGEGIPYGKDIYAFTSTTPQYEYTLRLMEDLRRKFDKPTYVIGGAHATAFKERLRKDGWDCVVVGEGERALLQICQFIDKHRDNNNSIRGVISGSHIEDINTIPFPDRNFRGFKKYNYTLNGYKATTMMTSRGCPFNCYFCCNIWGNRVRMRTADNVLEEVRLIRDSHNINAIQFYDDTFTMSNKRLYSLCKGLRSLGTTWRCFIHASTVNHNDLKMMKDSGCVEVGMGVESGSDLILKNVNKKIDVDRAIKVCNWCHEIGLRIKTFLIIGLPGETQETVNATIRFLECAKPDDFDYTIYTPFPNTYIWDNKEKFDINFNKEGLDYSKMFYKGKAGNYCSQVETSELHSESIETLRDFVDIQVRKQIKIPNGAILCRQDLK